VLDKMPQKPKKPLPAALAGTPAEAIDLVCKSAIYLLSEYWS
jgi:hypothetical protein